MTEPYLKDEGQKNEVEWDGVRKLNPHIPLCVVNGILNIHIREPTSWKHRDKY